MLGKLFLLTTAVVLTTQLTPCHADEAFFEKKIRPLLVQRCYACHGGARTSGGLSLDTRSGWQQGGESGPAIVPGKPRESLLIEAINYQSFEMPPPDKGGKLPEEEIAALTKWVTLGAPDPRVAVAKLGGMSEAEATTWWAFQPLPPADPEPSPETIDSFIVATLDALSLYPTPPTDKRTLIRRATYDLTGLPPTPEEVDAFLADESPGAFETVIERLLDSPQYGVKWGRHWLDVVRYADTAGENTDRPLPHAWRYRNWVFESFQRDLPYHEFVRLQIGGDVVRANASPAERNEGVIATGYLAVARRFGHDIDKDVHLMHEDVIDNLGKNFLGLALGCARCHDHKFDPVTSADYYALYGILSSTRFSFPGCEPKGQPRDLVPLMVPARVDALMADYQDRLARYEAAQKKPAETTARLKQLAADSSRLLAQSQVGEGKSVPLAGETEGLLDRLSLGKGEVLQLSVLPNGSHGADSTRVEWEITRRGAEERKWSVADLIPRLIEHGPFVNDGGAIWCFLEVTDGPVFLHEKQEKINDKNGLNAWRIGDTPSVFVNASREAVSVWTTLPGQSFFVHPGPERPVSVAWVCPADGEYRIQGRVADAHPGGGDGVAFRLQHVASAEFGNGLLALARQTLETIAKPEKPVIPVAYAVGEATPQNARLHERGDPEKLGEEIPRRWLSVFGGNMVPANGGSGRRQLADWIVEHPLFARVMVNRIWQWHFGRGLVATPNDFGSRGQRPTHPELLDWLAAEFRRGGYHVKSMHRLIMNTAAYQRASAGTESLSTNDPDNRYLARFSRRRLAAEEIRDNLLMTGGNLDLSPGQAHPFPAEETWKFTQHNPFYAVYDTNLRSAYLMVQRQRRHPYLALFDGADPNSSTGLRRTTTVPTQTLYFLNDPFFHAQAASFSARVCKRPDDQQRTEHAFRLLFQREPTETERGLAARFLETYPGNSQERWAAYARVLLASNEFLYLD